MQDKKTIITNVVYLCKTLGISLPSKYQTSGRLGELLVYRFFKDAGVAVKPLFLTDSQSDFDLLVKGRRIEVKTALQSNGRYNFTLVKNRRAGINLFDEVIFVLLQSPDDTPVFLRATSEEVGQTSGFAGSMSYFVGRFSPVR